MDEEFILVSKEKIHKYETKIKELEEQLQNNNSPEFTIQDIEQLILKTEKNILTNLSEKPSQKQDNTEITELIIKNHKQLISNNEEIIKNLQLLVEHLEDTSHLQEMLDNINEIKNKLSTEEIEKEDVETAELEVSHLKILEKLQEIELFMSNLRILLSYVKPKNLEREK